MSKYSFIAVCTIGLMTLSSCGHKKISSQLKNSKPKLIEFSSEEGMQRLNRSKYKTDFFILSNHFESQTNKVYCGPTSAVIVLNSLRQQKLRDNVIQLKADKSLIIDQNRKYLSPERMYVFNRYTYNNIYNVEGAKTSQQVLGGPMDNGKSDWGYQLEQLAELLQTHGLIVDKHVVGKNFLLESLRHHVVESMNDSSNFVLVNYARKALGQKGGGHISPLGAYDKKTDSFLIMDVNPNKADWVWVKANDLFLSMQTFDTVENRGFLQISDSEEKTN